jgi:ectoine hydroxylase-related dioxygenase (phytanoyl-CoA dioxygenase family)
MLRSACSRRASWVRNRAPSVRSCSTRRSARTGHWPWHQDRTIAVRRRIDTPGFANWTVKSGIHHVEPPFALLERMVTIRIHLDEAGADNAPLLIAPGSHRLGRIPEHAIAGAVRRLGTRACLAGRGDAWLYATPILHASEPARTPASRRVLHVDFSADPLPNGLEWL